MISRVRCESRGDGRFVVSARQAGRELAPPIVCGAQLRHQERHIAPGRDRLGVASQFPL
jgi:hypothetical protein